MGHYNSEMTITGTRAGDDEYFRKHRCKEKKKLETKLSKINKKFSKFKIGSQIKLRKEFDRFDLYTYGYTEMTGLEFAFAELFPLDVSSIDEEQKLVFIKGTLGHEYGVDYRFLKLYKKK